MFALLFAGHDTSSHTLTSLIFFSIKYPEKFNLVNQEITHQIGSGSVEDLTLMQMNEMEHFNRFLKETLRFDPPFQHSIHYFATRNAEICGVRITQGTRI